MSKSFALKVYFLIIVAALFLCSPAFCASKKKNKKADKTSSVEKINSENADNKTDDTKGLSLYVPSKKYTYFHKIDPAVLNGVEDGSPASIRSAMSQIRQVSGEYEESEKVLIYIASEIMKIAYPSERITWDVFPLSEDNPYSGAISSVNQGIFDSSTGNVDFLTILLPALVIFKSSVNPADYVNCENAILSALQEKPDSTLANFTMAVLKEKQGLFTEAEKYYTTVYNKASANEDVALKYIGILRTNNKLDAASQVLGTISKDTNDISILKQNAYIAFDAKDYSSAELYVAKVLQQTPNDLEFLLFRAKILIEKNDYIHAVSLLDMYARQDNSSIDYLILRARVQLDWSKNTSAATETVEKALQLYPDNIDALMFAARISSATDSPVAGKYADELANMVLSKRPESSEAMGYALKGLIQRENWQDAYEISKNLINDKNVLPEVIEQYITICIKLGKTNEAYEYAKKQYEANPDNELILQAYIFAYCQVGNRDAVLKYIGSMLNTASPKMKSYLLYRRSYLQLTEENILADLRSSLISNPRNSDSLFRLYELYFAKKDYHKAQYYLRQVVAINPNDNSVKQLNEALTKLIK